MVVAMCFSSSVCSRMTVRFAKGLLRRMIEIICKNLVNVPDFPKNFVLLDCKILIILDRPLCKRPAEKDDPDHLQKLVVVPDRSICDSPAQNVDLHQLQKSVLPKCPICNSQAQNDDLHHLQNNALPQ